MNSLTNVETQCLASLLFDQKLIDRDAKHCVSTVGLAIQNGNRLRSRENFLRPERATEF
ncbi:MAG: hypothetical protein LBB88_05850 [Planctomycetaceae bacterium]|nr:hypothetical protein [Planctomycetaceae bacterium]